MKNGGDDYILRGPERQFQVHQKGIGWAFYEGLLKNKDKTGQICAETGVQDTFGDVLQRSVRTAIAMKKRGVKSGDVVTLCAYNNMNCAVCLLAGLFLNCKIACLDPSLSVSDTKHLAYQTKPKMIFLGEEAEDLIVEVLDDAPFKSEVITFGNSSRYERFVNFLMPDPEEDTFLPVPAQSLRDTCVIFFSSGTTGMPKGICLHHYGLMCQAAAGEEMGGLPSSVMSFASHYWISCLFLLYMSVRSGIPRLVVPKFDPVKAWEVIDIFRPSFLFAAPSQLLDMLKRGGVPKGKNVAIAVIMTGGHAVSPVQLQHIRNNFPNTKVAEGYGMTEVSGAVAYFNLKSEEDTRLFELKKGSCGRPVSGLTYKVVDTETKEICGPNQRGELRVKSEFLMNGYYNQDSSSAWDADGWLKTGDVVYYDEDNCFYIVDRVKEMLKYKSWHVVPAKLESVIAQHPDVVNVVVVGVPHPEDGDHPCGVVTLKENAKVTADELMKLANAQLDDRQQLRGGLKIISEFPSTPSGKIKRREVRQNVIDGVY